MKKVKSEDMIERQYKFKLILKITSEDESVLPSDRSYQERVSSLKYDSDFETY